MTNPLTQAFSMLNDIETVDRVYWNTFDIFGGTKPLVTPRIQVANQAWRKAAAKYNLTLIDGAGPSFGRRDTNYDNIHYLLNDPVSFKRVGGRIGNEVTYTFAQLMMAGLLQAFES